MANNFLANSYVEVLGLRHAVTGNAHCPLLAWEGLATTDLFKRGWNNPLPGAYLHCSMNKDQNYFYNKSLQPYASRLRKQMTKAEACLRKYVLKAGQLKGFQFRRQRPVLNYIADFMCKELKLIIEVDGITHHSEDR